MSASSVFKSSKIVPDVVDSPPNDIIQVDGHVPHLKRKEQYALAVRAKDFTLKEGDLTFYLKGLKDEDNTQLLRITTLAETINEGGHDEHDPPFKMEKLEIAVKPFNPKKALKRKILSYPSGATVELGNELTPTQVKDQPTVSYTADPDSFYTLIFTDPDIYDSPELTNRECQHWLVVNIPGIDVTKGEVLSGYIGSGPPEGAGIHRYVYVLFKQPKKLSFEEKKLDNKSINGRTAFSTKKFAEKYNLGAPVAGNFYRAQFDDYVPQLYKSLGV